jgi:serine/threonine protein kinase/Flp pilus assembly protein TadD
LNALMEEFQDILGHRFTVEREIGRGGMATVYLAEEHRPRRKVAVKVLDPLLGRGMGRERFLREVEFAAQLTHPNIIPIFAADEVGQVLYYTMPYIEGDSLRLRLARNGKVPDGEALQIAREVGDALHYAHMQGVVHRDIKPENILLSNGHALIADFGIARAMCAACDDNLTIAGIPIGTPGYMSPEQTRGLDVDPRADIYSLGCVIYEMLTAKPPFKGPTIEAIIQARYSRPTPTLRGAGWTASATVDSAVRRAMDLNPDNRFETAAAFVSALASAVSGELDPDVRASAALPATQDALIAVSPDKAVAVLPFANLSADPENEYFSDGITDDIITQLSKVAGLRVTSRTSVMQYKSTTKSLGQIGDELRVTNILEGSVRRIGNRVRVAAQLIDSTTDRHLWAERYDRELTDIFGIQSEIAEQIAAALEATLSPDDKAKLAKKPTSNMEAYNLYLQGRFYWSKFTVTGVERAIDCFQRAAQADEQYALAYAGLADCYLLMSATLGKLPPTDGLAKAKEAALKAIQIDESLADAYATLGATCMWLDWDWDGADRALGRAVELNPDGEKAILMRNFYLAALGRHDEAIAGARRAVKLHPISPLIRSNLGVHYYWARRFDEAVEALRETEELDPGFPPAHYLLGWSYIQVRRFDEAIAETQRAIELAGNTPQRTAALGCAMAAAGRTDDAQAVLAEILSRSPAEYVSAADVAMLYAALGNHDEAFEWLHQAIDQRAGWLAYLNVDPIWDSLREDPRFAKAVQRLNLP